MCMKQQVSLQICLIVHHQRNTLITDDQRLGHCTGVLIRQLKEYVAADAWEC